MKLGLLDIDIVVGGGCWYCIGLILYMGLLQDVLGKYCMAIATVVCGYVMVWQER